MSRQEGSRVRRGSESLTEYEVTSGRSCEVTGQGGWNAAGDAERHSSVATGHGAGADQPALMGSAACFLVPCGRFGRPCGRLLTAELLYKARHDKISQPLILPTPFPHLEPKQR